MFRSGRPQVTTRRKRPLTTNVLFPEYLFPETLTQPNYGYEAARELFNLQVFDCINDGPANPNPLVEEFIFAKG
jgi:hypothetical protein